MYQMNDEERAVRAQQKALHQAVRADMSEGHRYRNLAWAFARGFKYRRVERSHHMTEVPSHCARDANVVKMGERFFYEHKMPYHGRLHELLSQHLPALTKAEVIAWLADRTGAIAAPVRIKRSYMEPAEHAPAAE